MATFPMMHFERPKMYQVWIMTRTLPVFVQIHITFSMIIVCHLTFSWIVLNVVTISKDLTRVKYTFKNLRWVSYFSRSVINRIYFPWFVISKRYISWTVTRRLSTIYLCVLVNICEQTTSEIHERHCYGLFTRDVADMCYRPGAWYYG